jgi:exonuclease III
LDYFWISPKLFDSIESIQHQVDVFWSDHCPICLNIM